MNAFLNKAFIDSQNPKGHAVKPHTKPRIPMSYIHTRECDTYYELSQAGYQSLPKSINQMLNSRRHSKPKARITTDQKTGRLLAKVIKVRVADLDVYSPKTDYDFRISINLEKSMPEAWQPLVQPRPKSVAKVLRNKDRLSYRHLAYQIDLTQVISSDVSSASSIPPRSQADFATVGPKRARARSRAFSSRATQARHALARRPAQRVSETR